MWTLNRLGVDKTPRRRIFSHGPLSFAFSLLFFFIHPTRLYKQCNLSVNLLRVLLPWLLGLLVQVLWVLFNEHPLHSSPTLIMLQRKLNNNKSKQTLKQVKAKPLFLERPTKSWRPSCMGQRRSRKKMLKLTPRYWQEASTSTNSQVSQSSIIPTTPDSSH